MKQLNVAISDEVYAEAKYAADCEGMLLRRWVERAISTHALSKRGKRVEDRVDRERRLVPVEEI